MEAWTSADHSFGKTQKWNVASNEPISLVLLTKTLWPLLAAGPKRFMIRMSKKDEVIGVGSFVLLD